MNLSVMKMITKISKSQYEEGHLYHFNDKNVAFINGPDGPMSKWLASLEVDEISDYGHVGCFILSERSMATNS